MKKTLILIAALALGVGSASADALKAAVTFEGKDIAESWFVVSANAENVVLSAAASGAGATEIAASRISSIAFETPDGWDAAMETYDKQSFETSARRFGALADDLEGIAGYPDSFGARARYLQLESLRQSGDIAAITAAIKKTRRNPIALGEAFQTQMKLYDTWAAAGDGDWSDVLRQVRAYEAEKPDGDANPTAAPFEGQPANEYVQLVYLRGLANQGAGESDAALNDFYRAAALNFGTEADVAAQATVAALGILKERATAEEPSAYAMAEGHALAVAYRDRFGKGQFPKDFDLFEKAPE